MSQYLPCSRCGSRVINKLQYYDLCGCQVSGMLEEQTAFEREARWLHEACKLNGKGQIAEGKALVEAILLDHPKSEAALKLLWQFHDRINET